MNLLPLQARQVVDAWRQGRPPGVGLPTVTIGAFPAFYPLQGFHLVTGAAGMGKSHALAWWQEQFLQDGWAVSLVHPASLPESSLWNLLISPLVVSPQDSGGLLGLFRRIQTCLKNNHQPPGDEQFWQDLSDRGNWQFSHILESESLWMALRAWLTQEPKAQARVEDWLTMPHLYVGKESLLYRELVWDLRDYFPVPLQSAIRLDAQMDWAWMRDMGLLLRAIGCHGWVWLWDDLSADAVLTLKPVLTSDESGADLIVGSVYPDFKDTLTQALLQQHHWAFDFSWLDQVETVTLPTWDAKTAQTFEKIVLNVYERAYGVKYKPESVLSSHIHSIREVLQAKVKQLDGLHG